MQLDQNPDDLPFDYICNGTMQELLTSWARLARSKHHDAAFLQASLLFVVRAFAARGRPPNGQPQLAMSLAEAASAAASHGDRCCKCAGTCCVGYNCS